MENDDNEDRGDDEFDGNGEHEQVPNEEQLKSEHSRPDFKSSMKWDETKPPPLEPLSSRANLIYDAGLPLRE